VKKSIRMSRKVNAEWGETKKKFIKKGSTEGGKRKSGRGVDVESELIARLGTRWPRPKGPKRKTNFSNEIREPIEKKRDRTEGEKPSSVGVERLNKASYQRIWGGPGKKKETHGESLVTTTQAIGRRKQGRDHKEK